MIPPDTTVGRVRLRVADLDDLAAFYERVVGLGAVERDGGLARLGSTDGDALVELVSAPDAPRAPTFSTGLFHLAILVPDRAELARSLQRVIAAGWRLTGASDHLVSEALYLQDPEGNGIEIYRDRPREEWSIVDGQIQMATLPLDLQGIAGLADEADSGMPAGTSIGHVHLQVSGLASADSFYHRLLGWGPWNVYEYTSANLTEMTVRGELVESSYLGAETQAGPVGFVLARLAAGEAEILTLAVARSHRREGLGWQLMDAVLRELHAQRATLGFVVGLVIAAFVALAAGAAIYDIGKALTIW